MTREFVWILGALAVLIALEYALGVDPRSAESWLLFGVVIVGVVVISLIAAALKRSD